MKKPEALALAHQANPSITAVTSIRSIARLWGGMGFIEQWTCQQQQNHGGGSETTLIAKQITCRNPTSFGDRRKAASYHVEANFYDRHAEHLTDICCRGLHVEKNANDDNSNMKDCRITIIMTPLPNSTIYSLSGPTAEAAVRSVARLHAHYWGPQKAAEAVQEGGLASQGTYWYLDTRPDEYDNLSSRGMEGKLKRAARTLDQKLKDHAYQTIVHGDLKSCNMSLSNDPKYVTLVDFQYVGQACCAKDLAYLFVCGMDMDDEVTFEQDQEPAYLELYIAELRARGVANDQAPNVTELGKALDLAYCDLYRWMCGWGIWGNSTFLEARVNRVLDSIMADV